MFIEVTTTEGSRLLNLDHVISISDASYVGGGCFIETINHHLRVRESYSHLQTSILSYDDKSRIK